MIIRPATLGDAPEVTRAFLAARRDAMPYLPELHTDEETASFVRWLIRDRETYVADVDGEVAGFAVIHDGLLEHLYVAPARQGKGIGSHLLVVAKSRCPAGLGLWAFQRNVRARAFYERHGFVLDHETDGADNEEREPDVFYVWRPSLPAAR